MCTAFISQIKYLIEEILFTTAAAAQLDSTRNVLEGVLFSIFVIVVVLAFENTERYTRKYNSYPKQFLLIPEKNK